MKLLRGALIARRSFVQGLRNKKNKIEIELSRYNKIPSARIQDCFTDEGWDEYAVLWLQNQFA